MGERVNERMIHLNKDMERKECILSQGRDKNNIVKRNKVYGEYRERERERDRGRERERKRERERERERKE